MPILPLPVFEADADPRYRTALSDEEQYARLKPPKTIVVRFGAMKLVAEYPYDGDAKPGCGTRLVARTHRGTEVVEMLTTTCENAGCSKSVTRQEMLNYIENSGGGDYPFHTEGRILRIATLEDLNRQSQLGATKRDLLAGCRAVIAEFGLTMKLVDAEPILGGELLTFYYMSDERVDFRHLVRRLAAQFKTRIEMRQVGARDEARLVADYERCGQHCCCKSFLKVLKPVSMKSAKVQKATLDPLKISGRCGRLMCCLRYEDQTYTELKARLPKRGTRVGTPQGPGVIIDGKILVQLVLVKLDEDEKEIAVPVEELVDPAACPQPGTREWHEARKRFDDPLRGLSTEEAAGGLGAGGDADRPDDRREGRRDGRRRRDSRERRDRPARQDGFRERSQREERSLARNERHGPPAQAQGRHPGAAPGPAPGGASTGPPEPPGADPQRPQDASQSRGEDGASRRRRQRRRRRRGGGPDQPPSGALPPDAPPSSPPGAPPEPPPGPGAPPGAPPGG